MNQQGKILVDPSEYLNIINSSKAIFRRAAEIYNAKPRVFYDPSIQTDTDELNIKSDVLNFVTEGLTFDEQVVKIKAPFTLPYNKKYVDEIFDNKYKINEDLKIERGKYKIRFKQSKTLLQKASNNKEKSPLSDQFKHGIHHYKFKPKSYFVDNKYLSLSDGNMKKNPISNSAEFFSNSDFRLFLTENEKKEKIHPKETNKIDWDEYLIDSLSESTARWIVMKRVTDQEQKKKLQNLVENKFGRYTRDIKDLEFYEDSLKKNVEDKKNDEKEKMVIEKSFKEK